MNRVQIQCFLVVVSGIAALFATSAQSQVGPPKQYVTLQPTNPGSSQTGHANINGAVRAGQFIGNGTEITAINGNNITVGQVADWALSPNVARQNFTNIFTNRNTFLGQFTGIKRSDQVTGAESFGIGFDSPGYDGMYVQTSATGLPFYGYSLGGAVTAYHYIDGSDGQKWKFYQGNDIAMTIDALGRTGLGTMSPTARLDVNGEIRANRLTINSGTSPDGRIIATTTTGLFQDAAILGTCTGTGLSNAGGRFVGEGNAYGLTVRSSNTISAVFEGATGGIQVSTFNGTGAQITGRGTGVYGSATHPSSPIGVWGAVSGTASGSYGVYSSGNMGASGLKPFQIDHPFDPENKFLLHYSSESPEPLNFYTGNVVTDSSGSAWVQLPDYFSEINRDFRYTLTVVDDSDNDEFVLAKVAKEIDGNRFKIRTSAPYVKVSWRVDAVRSDRYVQRYGAPTEIDKPEHFKGTYSHPELYGQPEHKRMDAPNRRFGQTPPGKLR